MGTSYFGTTSLKPLSRSIDAHSVTKTKSFFSEEEMTRCESCPESPRGDPEWILDGEGQKGRAYLVVGQNTGVLLLDDFLISKELSNWYSYAG